jgi:hypothetical protein
MLAVMFWCQGGSAGMIIEYTSSTITTTTLLSVAVVLCLRVGNEAVNRHQRPVWGFDLAVLEHLLTRACFDSTLVQSADSSSRCLCWQQGLLAGLSCIGGCLLPETHREASLKRVPVPAACTVLQRTRAIASVQFWRVTRLLT